LLQHNMTIAPMTPQPTKSTSNSRSNKVLGQLQAIWDTLQKDLASTKAQLNSAREAKTTHEQQSKDYTLSNQECRTHIQELLKLLEAKQHSLNLTKHQSVGLEAQTKKLKDDALMSRRNLDELKKRESRLVQDRDAAVLAKTRVEQQQKVLQQSIRDMDNRLGQEQQLLKKQLDQLQRQVQRITDRNEWMTKIMVSSMENETELRQEWIHQVSIRQQQHDKVTELFINRIRSELELLLDQMITLGYGGVTLGNRDNSSSNRLDALIMLNLDQKVEQCQADVNCLVHRIQSYSVLSIQ
ncbi:hypothetical protein BC941DRAFT_360263, partial [Chlamydoabsidia padenii]